MLECPIMYCRSPLPPLKKMKNMLKSRMKEKGLFDEEDRLRVLSKLGDSLEKLNEK